MSGGGAHAVGDRGGRGVHDTYALRLVGEVAALRARPDLQEAERRYREGLALAETLQMRPLVAHCHLGLGTLYRRTGNEHEAQEHLTTATTMYREMDMRFYLTQADEDIRNLSE